MKMKNVWDNILGGEFCSFLPSVSCATQTPPPLSQPTHIREGIGHKFPVYGNTQVLAHEFVLKVPKH